MAQCLTAQTELFLSYANASLSALLSVNAYTAIVEVDRADSVITLSCLGSRDPPETPATHESQTDADRESGSIRSRGCKTK